MTAKTSDLVTRIKSRISLPDNDDRFNPSELVDIMNEVLEESVLPQLMRYNEEYLILDQVVPLRDVNNVQKYPDLLIPMPRRTYGLTLRELKYRSDTLDQGLSLRDLNIPYVELSDAELRRGVWDSPSSSTTLAYHFFGSAVKLIGSSEQLTGSLVFTYVVKPSVLVNTDTQFAAISDVSYTSPTTSFTVASVGAELNTYGAEGSLKLYDVFDLASGHYLYVDVPFTRTGLVYTTDTLDSITSVKVESFQAGGFPIISATYNPSLVLLPAGQSQYSALPKEYDNMLVYYACQRVLESLGDTEGLMVNQQQLERTQKSIQSAYGARLKGDTKKVTNRRGLMAHITARGQNSRWWRR